MLVMFLDIKTEQDFNDKKLNIVHNFPSSFDIKTDV